MNTNTRIFICLMAGCMLNAIATRAATVDSRDNPYKTISATNVFRLKTPALRPEQFTPPEQPLPLITLQGIATITGRRQALFKVAMPAKPSESVREISYVLNEGERAGEIEVLEINAKSGTVTFRNHGAVQVLAVKQ